MSSKSFTSFHPLGGPQHNNSGLLGVILQENFSSISQYDSAMRSNTSNHKLKQIANDYVLTNPRLGCSSYMTDRTSKHHIKQNILGGKGDLSYFSGEDQQIITLNNRKFVTSKSPKKRSVSPQPTIHRLKPLRSKSPVFVQKDAEEKVLKQKIKVLEARLEEFQKEKQSSIIELLKERQQLKEQLKRESLSIAKMRKQIEDQQVEITLLKQQLNEKKQNPSVSSRLLELSRNDELEELRKENLELREKLQVQEKAPATQQNDLSSVICINQNLIQGKVIQQMQTFQKIGGPLINKNLQLQRQLQEKEGEIKMKDLIAYETAKIVNEIGEIVATMNQKNFDKSIQRVKLILSRLQGECPADPTSVIQEFITCATREADNHIDSE